MKNNLIKSLIATTLLTASLSAKAYQVETLELPESVNSQVTQRDFTREVLQKLRLTAPPGQEGIEHSELPQKPVPTLSRTSFVIENTLSAVKGLPMGGKIQKFESAIADVIKASGQNPVELTARITLNRAMDLMQTVMPIAGVPTTNDAEGSEDEVARFAANFYTEAFTLSLAYSNNKYTLGSILSFNEIYENTMFQANYGFTLANLIFRFSQNAGIDTSAKAVMLIKAIGYLGWDIMADVRHFRVDGFREILVEIYKLQKEDPDMKSILESLNAGFKPNESNIKRLRGKVFGLLQKMPRALAQVDDQMKLLPR